MRIVLFLVIYIIIIRADESEDKLKFHPPFQSFNSFDGSRHIPYWRTGGDAVIYDSFIRLTPDSPGKRGFISSDVPIQAKRFTTALRYRISGKGRNFFGDGFVLLFSQSPVYSTGRFFGTRGAFTGFAVVFDTYKNTEREQVHKDISLLFNDGKRDITDDIVEVPGCDSPFRYSELRSDFSINKYSEVRIVYDGVKKEIKIFVDPQGKNQFTECTTVPFSKEMNFDFDSIYLTLSSTTGELSDNHDILSLYTFYDVVESTQLPSLEDITSKEINEKIDASIDTFLNTFGMDRETLNGIERALIQNQRDSEVATDLKLSELEHHLEFQLTDVHTNLQKMIEKLKDQESKSITKMEDIEKLVNKMIQDKMNNELKERLANVENTLKKLIIKEIDTKSSYWKFPYFFLCLVLIIVSVIIYKKYKSFMKSNLM